MAITIYDICGLKPLFREMLSKVNAHVVTGQMKVNDKSGTYQSVDNLSWVARDQVESIIVEANKNDEYYDACFKEELKKLRRKNIAEFWNLEHAAVIFCGFGVTDDHIIKIFHEVDEDYINKELLK